MSSMTKTAGNSVAVAALTFLFTLCLWSCGSDPGQNDSADSDTNDVLQSDETDATDNDGTSGGDSEEVISTECQDDELEPSTMNQPIGVDESTTFSQLVICRFTDDWFAIDLFEGDVVTVTMSYDFTAGDLDIALIDEFYQSLGSSATDSTETITYSATSPMRVLLRVYTIGHAENSYDLEVTISSFDEGCANDPEEPNPTMETATEASPPYELQTRLCFDDRDWFQFDVPAGEMAAAVIAFSHRVGDLDMRAYFSNQPGTVAYEAESDTDNESIAFGPYEEGVTVYLEIYGYDGAFNTYQLTIATFSSDTVPVEVSGEVTYEDQEYNANGFTGELAIQPARGFVVEIVRELDDLVVASTTTDDEGLFVVETQTHLVLPYYVRALTRLGELGLDSEVRDRSRADAVYAMGSDSFSVSEPSSVVRNVTARADLPAGGAFNILDTVWAGFEVITRHIDEPTHPLLVRWQQGMAFLCRSCYSDDTISLGGAVDDPDEYDDDIILHEFGHFFVDRHSIDSSPGGSHFGEQTNPLLAYSEGLATFFSSNVRGTPTYVDNYFDGYRSMNIETADEDPEQFYGTEDGSVTGDVSEFLVAAILWDAMDPTHQDEPFDQLEMGEVGVFEVVVDYITLGERPDMGVGGVDLADWLNGFGCLFPESADGIAQLCEEDRDFPWTPDDLDCPAEKPNLASPLRLVQREGRLWIETEHAHIGGDDLMLVSDMGYGWQQWEIACPVFPCDTGIASDTNGVFVVSPTRGQQPFRAGSWTGPAATNRLLGGRLVTGPNGMIREYR